VLIAAAASSAQIPYEPGQWSLPYELGPSIIEDGDGNPSTNWATHEIAHVLLAPPSRNAGEPRSDRVLLQAIQGGGCIGCTVSLTGTKFGRLYRWSPRNPTPQH
jgi:hypothetical protein